MIDKALLEAVLDGGSLVLLAAIIVWALKWGIPAFLNEIRTSRSEYRADLQRMHDDNTRGLANNTLAVTKNTHAIETLCDNISEMRAERRQ